MPGTAALGEHAVHAIAKTCGRNLPRNVRSVLRDPARAQGSSVPWGPVPADVQPTLPRYGRAMKVATEGRSCVRVQPCSCKPWLGRPPNPAQTAPRRGWHQGKDQFQNAGPPTCGDSDYLWLPEACHQGTTCCPPGCLAMAAAAQLCDLELGEGAEGWEGGRQVPGKGTHPQPGCRSGRDRAQKAVGCTGRTQAVQAWVCLAAQSLICHDFGQAA